jgi:hypothetical protein
MLFYYQNIRAFIQLLETQSDLLSEQDKIDLKQLYETLPAAIEDMSNAIVVWYKTRPHILNAQLAILNPLLDNDAMRGAGGTGCPEITPEDVRELQEQLINIMRVNLPPEPEPNNKDSNQTSQ